MRYMRKSIRRRRTWALLGAFAVMLFITCGIYYKSYISTNVYQNEPEFVAYANQQFDARKFFQSTGHEKTEYQYGTPISYAVDYDIYENEKVTAFRDHQIENIKASFYNAKEAEEAERAEKYGERIGYKPLSHALLISSGTYESSNGVISLAIYESSSTEKEKDMAKDSANIYTYQFSAKTGERLLPVQIFKENYRQICSAYFTDFFQKNYEEADFAKNWESHLSSAETNFNKFTVTESGVTFFFDEGTVLKKEKGPVYAGMTNAEIEMGMRAHIIERYIDPAKPMVALTYDDGPGADAETRILNCLESNNAVATFFYQGYRIAGNEDKIKRAYHLGCEIGNHTWNHPVLTKIDIVRANEQLVNTNQAIYAACGAYPTVFRPSYGLTNDEINKASGMPVIMWTIDPEDWKYRDGQKIFEHVQGCGNLDGKIILLHSIHDTTADATEILVPWLKSQGYQLVTVSELIKSKKGADPKPGETYR